jgi:hypothetical protein
MAHTDPELLDRLREANNRQLTPERDHDRPLRARPAARAVVLCDSCGGAVDEPGRFRHRDCPPPPLPPAAVSVFERLRSRREERAL